MAVAVVYESRLEFVTTLGSAWSMEICHLCFCFISPDFIVGHGNEYFLIVVRACPQLGGPAVLKQQMGCNTFWSDFFGLRFVGRRCHYDLWAYTPLEAR